MTKYKLEIEYVGTNYSGWQIQENAPSIQQAIEEAIFKFCGEKTFAYSCGRTDAGVHAIKMPAHIELSKEYDEYKILMATNFHLSNANETISISKVEKVSDDFHARFNCKRRHYIYKIINRPTKPVIMENRMNKVAQHLIGKHDFSTFRASECQAKSPIKTLEKINIENKGEEIIINISAPSFLHHQVRNIAGTLSLVGTHKWTEEKFINAFKACDRTKGGPTAPAHGLYFNYAEY